MLLFIEWWDIDRADQQTELMNTKAEKVGDKAGDGRDKDKLKTW